MSFYSFLSESVESEQKLKHLEHAEDHVINAGHAGFSHAFHNLKDVHDRLTGNHNETKVTMKYDGSPSVIFGTNPENGKFFVASKSAFNKNPKLNYTPEDIIKNHGHAPGLVEKLSAALEHLPKVAPRTGVYQGDVMHTRGDVSQTRDKVRFTPNTITYSAPKNSKQGKEALNSEIGVAVHTAYKGKNMEDMAAQYAPDLATTFKKHPDVHLISTEHNLDKLDYTPEQQAKFAKHMRAAAEAHKKTPPESYEAIKGHEIPLKTYINHTVRTGTTPSVNGFIEHYDNSHRKKIDAVKSDKAKAAKTAERDAAIIHTTQNRNHFENILTMHKHLQKAKDVLVNTLSSNAEFDHHIRGKKSKPEGFVVVRHNRPTKLVDRADFSASNFNREQ